MIFVAVKFSDKKISQLFDLARILLQPDYARSSHITLKGPYAKKKDVGSETIGRDVGKITILRPGSFFTDRQSTVYLGIEILGISDFWYKPDFPEGTPHLSIYDGSDRRFAWVVLRTLKNFPWGMRLNSTPMRILDTKQRLETEFLMNFEAIAAAQTLVFGQVYSAEKLKSLSDLERIVMLNRVCTQIHFLSEHQSRLL